VRGRVEGLDGEEKGVELQPEDRRKKAEIIAWVGKSTVDIDVEEMAELSKMTTGEAAKMKYRLMDEEVKAPLSVDGLKEILGSTIARDDVNKVITFLCMLSAYTEDSQFNVGFRAPSSTGKSYIPIEVAHYFPPSDVVKVAYSSPTAFFHEVGEPDEAEGKIIVDLERKILMFLDQPHDQLLQRLRSLLSHDEKELLHKITDRSEKRGLRTKNVLLKGYPSVISCTGSLRMDEQEQTRNIILSPETSQEKIREGIYMKALRRGNPKAWEMYLKEHPEREILRKRVEAVKAAQVRHVMVKDPKVISERFQGRYSTLRSRHMRDIDRLISLIHALALLNLWHRERDDDGNVYASEEDIEAAFKLYDEIGECQELGLPPYVYKLYVEVIKPLYVERNQGRKDPTIEPTGISRREILKRHYEVYERSIGEDFLRKEVLPALEKAGLIYQEPDPFDKRRQLVHCILEDLPGRILDTGKTEAQEKGGLDHFNREQG
jgi:hypothetical protein